MADEKLARIAFEAAEGYSSAHRTRTSAVLLALIIEQLFYYQCGQGPDLPPLLI